MPKLLDVDDIVHVTKCDERSIITYLSQFVALDLQPLKKVEAQQSEVKQEEVKVVEQNEEDQHEEISEEVPVSEIQTFDYEEVKLDGFLYKQDVGWFKFWKKKYFVLQGLAPVDKLTLLRLQIVILEGERI